jgi:DNA-binding NarL/FixJ family response regulator
VADLVRVLVVDDQALVRAGFRMICEAEVDLTVVGEAADGVAAVELAARTAPDVVLMDIRMPAMDGVEACSRIVSAHEQVRVLILTTFDIDDYVYAALRAGASGFLLKDTPPEQLVEAIRVVAGGDALLSPSVTRRVIETFAASASPVPATPLAGLDTLTEREHDVLKLMAKGYSNAEIAATLFLGEATVKTHVGRVLMKLGLRDRVQAVVAAYEHGIVTPGARTEAAGE